MPSGLPGSKFFGNKNNTAAAPVSSDYLRLVVGVKSQIGSVIRNRKPVADKAQMYQYRHTLGTVGADRPSTVTSRRFTPGRPFCSVTVPASAVHASGLIRLPFANSHAARTLSVVDAKGNGLRRR
jgi:hypothetical protein